MSQHDFNIANQGFPSFRSDLNDALVALATTSSSATAPATTYANQLWYETDTNTLHIRNEANSAWLDLMVIDQSTGSPSFTAGNVGVGTEAPARKFHAEADAASTNSVIPVVRVARTSSGTPANGIGAGIEFVAETSSNNLEIGATIEAVTTDVTLNSEDFDLVFKLMAAGATATEAVRVSSGGVISNAVGAEISSVFQSGRLASGGTVNWLLAYRNGVGVFTGGTPVALRTDADGAGNVTALTFEIGGAIGSSEKARLTSAGYLGLGTTSPIVQLQASSDALFGGVVYRRQGTPASYAAAVTLTIADLLTGIVRYTGAAANLTFPTGTNIENGLPATFPNNHSFDFSVINTGSGTATLLTNTDLTLIGGMTVAAGASGQFRARKTATNTYTIYRLS